MSNLKFRRVKCSDLKMHTDTSSRKKLYEVLTYYMPTENGDPVDIYQIELLVK